MAKKTQKKPLGKLTSKDPKIQAALNKAKELESKKLPKKEDILKQDKEFKSDAKKLKKILTPQWFLNLKKQKASRFFKRKK